MREYFNKDLQCREKGHEQQRLKLVGPANEHVQDFPVAC